MWGKGNGWVVKLGGGICWGGQFAGVYVFLVGLKGTSHFSDSA